MFRRCAPQFHRGTLSAAATVLGLSLALSACGGSDKPDSDPSPSATTSATPSPSPTPTTTPLSSFEDRPQVKVARAWMAAAAQDINAKRRSIPNAVPYETESLRGLMSQIFAEDIGRYYPGPLPFTPVAVKAQGKKATVSACAWFKGWAVDPKTKQPVEKKVTGPTEFIVVKQEGQWKVDRWQVAKFDCNGVNVEAVTW
jgi:hypothetical protein